MPCCPVLIQPYFIHTTILLVCSQTKKLINWLIATLRNWFNGVYSEMLLDSLATQPTPELAIMMLQLVHSGDISGLRASVMINAMSLVVKPTPAVILVALVRWTVASSSSHFCSIEQLMQYNHSAECLLVCKLTYKTQHNILRIDYLYMKNACLRGHVPGRVSAWSAMMSELWLVGQIIRRDKWSTWMRNFYFQIIWRFVSFRAVVMYAILSLFAVLYIG